MKISNYVFLILALLLAACSSTPATEINVKPLPTAAPTTTIIPPSAHAPSNLSADPQRVEFQAADGAKLVGYYYPSKYADAPVMILMHWAGGELCDWDQVARWMQNRADESPVKIKRCSSRGEAWKDPSWFPKMNPAASFAVFTFDFRGFGESKFTSQTWEDFPKDALAAFETTAKLKGVNPKSMAALGASIGADGAADSCLLYNQKAGGGCLGAFSLSPGNYLGINYSDTVTSLAPNPVWCLAAEGDTEAAPTCKKATGDAYFQQVYKGGDHGMMLIRPGLDPLPMSLIQDFMKLALKEETK